MDKLVYINLTFACGGVIIKDNFIVDSAPIFKGWRGRRLSELIHYYKYKKQYINHEEIKNV